MGLGAIGMAALPLLRAAGLPVDLQAALADGRLRGALVDVYAQEPLPPQHPLWRCPSLVITPHMASVAPFERVAGQILENLRRLNAGEALMNLVDPRRGY
ncbi:2-hydroxyacid dehydrogenase [Bordetella pertussis]|nr:2-hydroxyacid dehydrogenase [Bordetella pertussis]